jgi:hypothetical protein
MVSRNGKYVLLSYPQVVYWCLKTFREDEKIRCTCFFLALKRSNTAVLFVYRVEFFGFKLLSVASCYVNCWHSSKVGVRDKLRYIWPRPPLSLITSKEPQPLNSAGRTFRLLHFSGRLASSSLLHLSLINPISFLRNPWNLVRLFKTELRTFYRVIKNSLCIWWLQHTKLQVMFNVSPASLQTFIDTRRKLTPSVIPNSDYVIMVSG